MSQLMCKFYLKSVFQFHSSLHWNRVIKYSKTDTHSDAKHKRDCYDDQNGICSKSDFISFFSGQISNKRRGCKKEEYFSESSENTEAFEK